MGLNQKTIKAAGAWDGSVGAGATAFGERGGAVTYGGVGDYDVTLDKGGIDNTELIFLCNLLGLNDHTIRTVNTNDAVKQVLIETTAAAAAGEGDMAWLAAHLRDLDGVVCVAGGHYNGAAAGAAAAYGERGGVVTRTGVGDYLITLDGHNGYDVTQGIVMCAITGAVPGAIRTQTVTDLTKQILTETVGGAAGPVDADFSWLCVRFAP
jgi:hypothetical protein